MAFDGQRRAYLTDEVCDIALLGRDLLPRLLDPSDGITLDEAWGYIGGSYGVSGMHSEDGLFSGVHFMPQLRFTPIQLAPPAGGGPAPDLAAAFGATEAEAAEPAAKRPRLDEGRRPAGRGTRPGDAQFDGRLQVPVARSEPLAQAAGQSAALAGLGRRCVPPGGPQRPAKRRSRVCQAPARNSRSDV